MAKLMPRLMMRLYLFAIIIVIFGTPLSHADVVPESQIYQATVPFSKLDFLLWKIQSAWNAQVFELQSPTPADFDTIGLTAVPETCPLLKSCKVIARFEYPAFDTATNSTVNKIEAVFTITDYKAFLKLSSDERKALVRQIASAIQLTFGTVLSPSEASVQQGKFTINVEKDFRLQVAFQGPIFGSMIRVNGINNSFLPKSLGAQRSCVVFGSDGEYTFSRDYFLQLALDGDTVKPGDSSIVVVEKFIADDLPSVTHTGAQPKSDIK